jgi:hypothetical protein
VASSRLGAACDATPRLFTQSNYQCSARRSEGNRRRLLAATGKSTPLQSKSNPVGRTTRDSQRASRARMPSYDSQSEPWLSMPQGRCAARKEQVRVGVVSDGWLSRSSVV